jgi:hypothetical protein
VGGDGGGWEGRSGACDVAETSHVVKCRALPRDAKSGYYYNRSARGGNIMTRLTVVIQVLVVQRLYCGFLYCLQKVECSILM